MTFFAELKRRNVIRVGIAWAALIWLLIAMCALLFPALGLPLSGLRWVLLGLLLIAPPLLVISWRYEFTGHGLRLDQGPDGHNPQRLITAKRLEQVTLVIILAALSLSLLRQFISANAPKETSPTSQFSALQTRTPRAPPGPIDPHSLAVLPFANHSPDPEDAYFSEGLSEELLNVLARVPGLKVTSRTSSFAMRQPGLDSREIAMQLGVAHLLTGSVRRQDQEVRITAQLTDARNGQLLWSQTYDRRLIDIFRVQEAISQAIADALVDSLGVRQVRVIKKTDDLQAYELFLRGRQLFAQRGANLPAARDLLERAVERDAQFADAWASLAATWYVWRSYAPEPAGIDTLQQAQTAVARALAINARHPGALAVSARLAADADNRLQQAVLIEQALALEPNNANTWLWKGLGLFEAGHLQAAHASFEQAQNLDPLSGLQLGWLGISDSLLGQPEIGVQMLQQSHALGWRGPAARALFFLALANDNNEEVTRRYLDWLHDDEIMPTSQRELAKDLAPALSDPSLRASAQQALLQAAEANPNEDWVILLQVFGATDAALAYSLQPDARRTQTLMLTLWFPAFKSFREHRQFTDFVHRRGLTDYWREHGHPTFCHLSSDLDTGCDEVKP